MCGGFFQPLKEKLVDIMYIVTSGEFNSLFAANNLCKGYINSQLQCREVRMGGLIGNCRGIVNEKAILLDFADKLKIPIVGIIPRDNRIEQSTFEGIPIIDKDAENDIIDIFKNIADTIVSNSYSGGTPCPMELDNIREIYGRNYTK